MARLPRFFMKKGTEKRGQIYFSILSITVGMESEVGLSGLCLLFDDQPRAPRRGPGSKSRANQLTHETDV